MRGQFEMRLMVAATEQWALQDAASLYFDGSHTQNYVGCASQLWAPTRGGQSHCVAETMQISQPAETSIQSVKWLALLQGLHFALERDIKHIVVLCSNAAMIGQVRLDALRKPLAADCHCNVCLLVLCDVWPVP